MSEADKAVSNIKSSVLKHVKFAQPIKIMPVTKEELKYAPDPKKIKQLYRQVNKNVPKLDFESMKLKRTNSVSGLFFKDRNSDRRKLNNNLLTNKKDHRRMLS